MIGVLYEVFDENVSGRVTVNRHKPQDQIDARRDAQNGEEKSKTGEDFVVVQIDGQHAMARVWQQITVHLTAKEQWYRLMGSTQWLVCGSKYPFI